MTYANGALWTFATPEGETFQALYKSTDWGNSWSQVSTNLPTNQNNYNTSLMALAPSPGLLYAFGNYDGGTTPTATYISEDGSDWSKVSYTNLVGNSMYGNSSEISSTGKFWVYYTEDSAMTSRRLYSIGGPLRNGRFFYYQKD